MKTSNLNQFLLLLTILIVFFGSCTKENPNELEPETQKILNFLSQNFGFDKRDLKVDNDNIVAESDIMFPIKDFWEKYGNTDHQDEHSLQDRIHRRHPYLIYVPFKSTKYINIYYSSELHINWVAALTDAVKEWNKLTGSIKFNTPKKTTGIYPVGSIGVFPMVLNNEKGSSYSPDNKGNPGSCIFLNKNYDSSLILSSSLKKLTVAHELGHTIGFHHTDTNDWYKIVTREFSCDNGLDSKSVMRSGDKNLNYWNGFSFCDKKAFYSLYPL